MKQVRRWRSSTRRPPRVLKKGVLARSFRLRRGQEDQGSQTAHPGRYAGSLVERRCSSGRRSGPDGAFHLLRRARRLFPFIQRIADGGYAGDKMARRSLCGAPGMEVGNREAIPYCRIRSLAQAMDRRKDIRLDQSQSPLGARLRTLCHDRRCLHPPRHDPHHAKATCCKCLVMNPIFSDGLSGRYMTA